MAVQVSRSSIIASFECFLPNLDPDQKQQISILRLTEETKEMFNKALENNYPHDIPLQLGYQQCFYLVKIASRIDTFISRHFDENPLSLYLVEHAPRLLSVFCLEPNSALDLEVTWVQLFDRKSKIPEQHFVEVSLKVAKWMVDEFLPSIAHHSITFGKTQKRIRETAICVPTGTPLANFFQMHLVEKGKPYETVMQESTLLKAEQRYMKIKINDLLSRPTRQSKRPKMSN